METLLLTTNTNGVYLWVLDNPQRERIKFADSTIRNYLKVARQEANLWVMVTDVGHNVTTQYKLI